MTNGKRRSKGGRFRSLKRAKSNPGRRRSRRNSMFMRSRRRHRRNPRTYGGFNLTQLGKLGVGAVFGGIATRGLPELVLKSNNVGVMGYFANAVVAIGGGMAVKKYADADVGVGFMAGGIALIIERAFGQFISKTSPATLGYSDVTFGRGLGLYYQIQSPRPQSQGGYYQVPGCLPAGASASSASQIGAANSAAAGPAPLAAPAAAKFKAKF